MPFVSSPVAYPPTSSPAASPLKKRKRNDDHDERAPLRTRSINAVTVKPSQPFQETSDNDDSDREDSGVDITNAKRTNHASESGYSRSSVATLDKQRTSLTEPTDTMTRDAGSTLGASILRRSNLSLAGRDAAVIAGLTIRSTSGRSLTLRQRPARESASYEQLVAARSETVAGRAQRSYYGIEINRLIEDAEVATAARAEIAAVQSQGNHKPSLVVDSKSVGRRSLMWTEKYRARKFTDLVGDDRTHRSVMHWLKTWDQVVFPGAARKPKHRSYRQDDDENKTHRKILLLTGPPGLGKTTLAHVCARQAGYEVAEINGSDDRSSGTVKGRIRDILGTENVKSASNAAGGADVKKVAKPVCLIVDEVDGVTGGSGAGGEGGFVKALIDLLLLDQRNAKNVGTAQAQTTTGRKKKGDNFRMLRPLVMICNDVYHNALRPLRTSQMVEVIHVGKPALNTVATRMQGIFQREGIMADGDAVRKLCEGCWGTTSKKEGGSGAGAGDGDIRSVMVLAEWIARRVRSQMATDEGPLRLTKKWLEAHLAQSGGGENLKGLGRGGTREIVDRIFMDNAGLSRLAAPTSTFALPRSSEPGGKSVKSVNEGLKAASSSHLRTLMDSHGESDRIMTDLFTQYPTQPFQDDTFLSKPNQAYQWLDFHDRISSAVFSSSEWELAPYLSSPAIGFHHLFATSSALRARHAATTGPSDLKSNTTISTDNPDTNPFLGAQSSFAAHERQKQHSSTLQTLHANLSPALTRLYPRPESMATEFTPYLLRCLAPNVNPVLITSSISNSSGPSSGARYENNKTTASVRKASEKVLIERSVRAMIATGTRFERCRVENDFGPSGDGQRPGGAGGQGHGGFVYRLQPAVDEFSVFCTLGKGRGNDIGNGISAAGGRYGVRQVLVQECAAEVRRLDMEARARRRGGGGEVDEVDEKDVEDKEGDVEAKKKRALKRDFFGRVIGTEVTLETPGIMTNAARVAQGIKSDAGKEGRIWVTFHEGYSNAVRKPVTLADLMRDM